MEKTTNNPLLPAGTGPERASISKVSEGPVPAGKKTSPPGDRPDAEVPQRPVRRSFLADYKLQILRQIETGEVWQCLNDGRLAGRQPVRHQQKNPPCGRVLIGSTDSLLSRLLTHSAANGCRS